MFGDSVWKFVHIFDTPCPHKHGREDMPIAALVTMTPIPGREDEMIALLEDVLADVRTEPGNLMAIALRDPADPTKLYEFAVYKDQAAIEAHRVAEHSVNKGPLVGALQSEPWTSQRFETIDWPE
jgi:quinol monooxygenase YgiN